MEHIMNNLPGADGMQERFEVARSANYVQGNAAVRVHVICSEEQFSPVRGPLARPMVGN